MILRTYTRVLTHDLPATVAGLRGVVGREPDLELSFGRFDICLIGPFCALSGVDEALDRYRSTVGPVVVDDIEATRTAVEAMGAELTMGPFDGPAGPAFLAVSPEGVEFEYVQLSPELARRVEEADGLRAV